MVADTDSFWSGLTASVSLTVLLVGALVACLQYVASNRHARQERTLHLDQAIDSLNNSRVMLETSLPRTLQSIDVNQVRAASAHASLDVPLEASLRAMLARLQIFSLAVQSGMADEDFAFELIGSTVVWYGTAYRPYIAAIRQSNNQPLLYGDLLFLAQRWTRRMELEVEAYGVHNAPFYARSRSLRRRMKRELRGPVVAVASAATQLAGLPDGPKEDTSDANGR